jgi:hypothetical protein
VMTLKCQQLNARNTGRRVAFKYGERKGHE